MNETGFDPAAAITDKLRDMTADEAVKTVRELCARLSGDAESFHGNIWPENIRLDWEGKAVLGEPSDVPANRREAEQVEYLAPEFFWENAGSAAADVYSLGLLLYAACSGGYLPFQPKGGLLTTKDRSGALRKRMKGEPIAPPAGITPALQDVIKKALSYEPEDRYISAKELLAALNETDEALPAPEAPEPEHPEASPEPDTPEAPGAATDPAPAEEAPAVEPALEAAPAEDKVEEPAPAAEAEAEPAPETAAPAPAPAKKKQSRKAKKAAAKKQQAPRQKGQPIQAEGAAEPETTEPMPEPAPEPGPIPEAAPVKEPEAPVIQEPVPEPEEQSAPEEPGTPRYTVQKDFEKRGRDRTAVPTANRKKRTSPLIPILCVAAVAVLAAAALMLKNHRAETRPTAAESVPAPYTIQPQPTEPPTPVQMTPSLGDDEDAVTVSPAPGAEGETEAEPQPEEPAEGAPVGSAMIDGMTVEPLGDIVRIADTGANLRTGPGTNYAVANSLPRGTELTRTGTVNGWSQVHYDGGEYYVASNLVTPVENGETPAEGETGGEDKPADTRKPAGDAAVLGTLVVTSDVNLRGGPGTEYEKLAEIKRGAVLTVEGRSDDGKWYQVTVDGRTGYVNRKLVSVRDYAEITPAAGTLTVTGEVNLRLGPGTGYDVLTVAKPGDKLTLTGTTDSGWYRVDHGGRTAYLASNYATVDP